MMAWLGFWPERRDCASTSRCVLKGSDMSRAFLLDANRKDFDAINYMSRLDVTGAGACMVM
jgi:hypothetical protein